MEMCTNGLQGNEKGEIPPARKQLQNPIGSWNDLRDKSYPCFQEKKRCDARISVDLEHPCSDCANTKKRCRNQDMQRKEISPNAEDVTKHRKIATESTNAIHVL